MSIRIKPKHSIFLAYYLTLFLTFLLCESAYAAVYYNINVTAEPASYGSITPSGDENGDVQVERGLDQAFQIETNPGYQILNVYIDGESKGNIESFTFEFVISDHTIYARFVPEGDVYSIDASAGVGGTITPSGIVRVEAGQDQGFTIQAEERYAILDVVLDVMHAFFAKLAVAQTADGVIFI